MTVAFGIQGSGQQVEGMPDPGRYRELAQAAEELGYDSIWAGDHISYRNPILDVVVALSTFAAVTERITLGAGIVLLPLRHPSVVAKEFASLDYVSRGRVILGVGVGGEGEKDFEAVGVDPRERGARTSEAMRALRALFGAQPASFEGRFFSFAEVEIAPGLAASRAGRRSGSAAAPRRRSGARPTLGDGWIPIWVSVERFREGLAQLPDHVVPAVTPPGACRRQADICTSTCASGTPATSPSTSSTATASPARRRSAWPGCASTWTPARSTSSSTRRSPRTRSGWRRWPVQPLADVRVLAIEQFGAGPWGTLQLADLGADVIKIEDPASGGDVGRYVPPFQEGEDSLFFETFNRNKQSVSLDLRHPEARDVFEDLVRGSDVVYSNLRGDQPAKLRLTYDDLKDVNPRIVCCSLSGFGMTGPRAAQGGYDYMMQGLAGWMSLTGDPDGPPTKSGLSLVDLSGGYGSAIAVLAGLWRARRDGVGCDCDVSLFDTALHELMYVGTWAASRGYVPSRRRNSAHPSIVPFQNFETADGWIVVACPKEKFWTLLCGAIERPDLPRSSRPSPTAIGAARSSRRSSTRSSAAARARNGWRCWAGRASRARR